MSSDLAEEPLGWLRLGCTVVAMGVIPLWIMLTALLMRSPEFEGLTGLALVVEAGMLGVAWVSLGAISVVALLLVLRGFSRVAQARAAQSRRALDASLTGDADLPADAWEDQKMVNPPSAPTEET